MTPIDRQIPDPLKLTRQKQIAEAKRLAAEQRQRSGLLKEQVKLVREAEMAEKAANAERLQTPLTKDPNGDATNKGDHLPKNFIGAATETEEQQLDPLT
jgi:hypothetical protein